MRKENSTHAINEQFLFQACELNSAIPMISGRWKSQIVYSISQGNNRFHLLKKELPNISDSVGMRFGQLGYNGSWIGKVDCFAIFNKQRLLFGVCIYLN